MTGPASAGLRRRLVNLRFAATLCDVRRALLGIDAQLTAAGASADLRTRAQIALAEACNNIVEHAYQPRPPGVAAMITIDIAGDSAGLQVTIRDKGRAMPDGPLPGRTLPQFDPDDPANLPEGGFGWALLRDMTRSLSISHQNGQNILRFRLLHADTPGHPDRSAV